MKKIVLTTYTKIIAWFLGIAGFATGCEINSPVPEYGVPSADFRAKGTVTDAVNNKPIPNIRVIGKAIHGQDADTVFTDANGNYTVDMQDMFGFPVKIYAEDVDGEKNGAFRTDSLLIEQRDAKQVKKGTGWYKGGFEKTDADFKLKADMPIPMYGIHGAEFNDKK